MPIGNGFSRSNQSERSETKWNGFHRALVIDAHDLRQLGRVKVRIPDLMPELGDDFTGEWDKNGLWAHPANNYMGGRNVQDMTGQRADFDQGWFQGSCLIPPNGSWVFVFFENGDPNHPFYFASLEGQRKVLPENRVGIEWEKKWTLLKSREGRCIIISDDKVDCRVEITGKKRLIFNEPDGDVVSVFTIEDNQTVILLDERDGFEKLLIKDYRGNYINIVTDQLGVKDQLHIFFQDDIHIETLKTLLIKAGDKIHMRAGSDIRITSGANIETKSTLYTKEKALGFERFAFIKDNRTALLGINDTTALTINHTAGMTHNDTALVKKTETTLGKKTLFSSILNMTGFFMINLYSKGIINISGKVTNIQCGASIAFGVFKFKFARIAKTAKKASPDGIRYQLPIVRKAPKAIVPDELLQTPLTTIIPPLVSDPYDISVGGVPVEVPDNKPSVINVIDTPSSDSTEPKTEIQKQAGVGHEYTLLLKDEYRRKIIPLIDKSYGKFVSFHLFKYWNSNTIDYQFFDENSCPVYSNYTDPDWIIDRNSKWWENLYEFCIQARSFNMTIVPTLFDFDNSKSNDPFVTHLPNPYSLVNWSDEHQGEYIRNVMDVINSTGVDYIINIGHRAYSTSPLLPSANWLNMLYILLVDELKIPIHKIALTADSGIDLYNRSPYFHYPVFTGEHIPTDDQINNDEKVDGHYGGTGRLAVYNSKNELIDGYLKYLRDCTSLSIPVMNFYKLSMFISTMPGDMDIDDPNCMNYLFAPTQREAMRIVLGNSDISNNGYIDFS